MSSLLDARVHSVMIVYIRMKMITGLAGGLAVLLHADFVKTLIAENAIFMAMADAG